MMQFILYCACGAVGVTVDYTVFYALFAFDAWYQLANAFGYLAGTIVSFVLNRIITFNVRDRIGRRFATFMLVAGLGFSASASLLWLLVEVLQFGAQGAKLITLPFVIALQFSLNRLITFRRMERV